jgi:hypothetical protein
MAKKCAGETIKDKILVDGHKVKLLENADIFDVYGCQSLLTKALGEDDLAYVKARVYEIQERYVTSAKARIRSEARFIGLSDFQVDTLARMLSQVKDFMAVDIQKAAMGGGPVNLMGIILKSHQRAGGDVSGINLGAYGVKKVEKEVKPQRDVDPDWFRKKKGDSRMFDDPKWAVIAEAFVKLEEATKASDIIEKISILNQLQHNSFHVLIDLQTGRMLEGMSEGKNSDPEARKNLEDVLNIARSDADPMNYVAKMSEEIRKIMVRTRNDKVDPSGRIK